MKRELIYTILDLEEWNQGATCRFCRGLNKAICQIRTRSKVTHSIVENDYACESCKEKFENNEIPKCERCGRLKTKSNIDFSSGEYICECIKDNEDLEEKELPVLPHEERASTRYERQINDLREKERELIEEIDTHLEALEIAEDWHKRQKQELLDKIAKLEQENSIYKEKVRQLEEQNKKLVPEELASKITSYEEEISSLKSQLEQLQEQQTAQIETPTKDKGLKSFFKFGSK